MIHVSIRAAKELVGNIRLWPSEIADIAVTTGRAACDWSILGDDGVFASTNKLDIEAHRITCPSCLVLIDSLLESSE